MIFGGCIRLVEAEIAKHTMVFLKKYKGVDYAFEPSPFCQRFIEFHVSPEVETSDESG